MLKRLPKSALPLTSAMMPNSTSTPIEMNDTTIANFSEIAAPAVLRATNAT